MRRERSNKSSAIYFDTRTKFSLKLKFHSKAQQFYRHLIISLTYMSLEKVQATLSGMLKSSSNMAKKNYREIACICTQMFCLIYSNSAYFSRFMASNVFSSLSFMCLSLVRVTAINHQKFKSCSVNRNHPHCI